MRFETSAFLNEMKKIASQLNDQEERERALKFMAIGATAGIPISGLGGVIKGGYPTLAKNMTQNAASIPRWVLGGATMGGMYGGLIPLLQSHVRDNLEGKARQRMQLEKMQRLVGQQPVVTGLPVRL